MPEARERKKSDKIKGKDSGGKSPVKKNVRRQMTVKLQKEFAEQKKNRDTGGNSDTTPEVQAAEQVEEKIYTTADSLREHTGNAVSKSISRHRRKQQKKKQQRTEQATGEAPTTDTEVAPPPAQERIRERAADDIKTRPVDNSHAVPIREQRPDIVREMPAASSPGPECTPAGPSPKERMRQTAIKEKQDQRTDIRQRPADIGGQRQADQPVREPAPAQPKPQERMRQMAKAELQAQRIADGRVSTPARPDRAPTPTHSAGITPASPDHQSINPIKERRSFAPKEKSAGGSFVPKTRQTTAATKSAVKTASTAAKGKKAARPLELAKRRVQRNAQRKMLQQSASKAKAALDLSRKAAVATTKAVASLISAIAGLLGGAFLIPIICVVALVAAIIASPFGILFSNEPTPDAMPLNVAVGQLIVTTVEKR